MARRLPPGTRGIGDTSRTNIRLQASVVPSRSNPANNFPQMRLSLLNNIREKVAKPLAAEMVSHAKYAYPWTPQDEDQHNPEHGYPNPNAHKTIMSGTGMANDQITIAIMHSPGTFQDRTAPPTRRRGKGGSGKSREDLDEAPERKVRSLADRRAAGVDGGNKGSGTPLGQGERDIVYYGNILEFGHGGDPGALKDGRFGILVETWKRYQPRFMQMIQGDMLDGIDFKGAAQAPKAPKRSGPTGRSIKVTRR